MALFHHAGHHVVDVDDKRRRLDSDVAEQCQYLGKRVRVKRGYADVG